MTKSEKRKIFLGARRVDEVEEAKNIFRELEVVRSRDEQKVFFRSSPPNTRNGNSCRTRETEITVRRTQESEITAELKKTDITVRRTLKRKQLEN